MSRHKERNPKPDGFGLLVEKFALRRVIEISALGELGSTTGGLQTVFFVVCRLKPLKTLAFFASASKITSIVTSKMGILFEPKEFCDQFVTATPISAEYYLNYIVFSAAPISLLMQIDLV